MKTFISVVLLISLAACGGSGDSGDSDDEDNDDDSDLEATLSSIQSNIFTPTCASTGSCHQSGIASGGLSLEEGESFSNLVNVESDQADGVDRVEPGDPDASYIINKLEGTQAQVGGGQQTMPKTGSVTDDEIQAIRDWIENGAEDD